MTKSLWKEVTQIFLYTTPMCIWLRVAHNTHLLYVPSNVTRELGAIRQNKKYFFLFFLFIFTSHSVSMCSVLRLEKTNIAWAIKRTYKWRFCCCCCSNTHQFSFCYFSHENCRVVCRWVCICVQMCDFFASPFLLLFTNSFSCFRFASQMNNNLFLLESKTELSTMHWHFIAFVYKF